MKKKYVLAAMIVLAMGMTACSIEQVGETSQPEAAAGSQTANDETFNNETANDETANDENAGTGAMKTEAEPIFVSVESYEDDMIVVKDPDTGSILYFSTKEAEVIEGDAPIAAGDLVEITYRGEQGDKDHPGMAVKVVELSMRECTMVVSVKSYENGIIVVRDMDDEDIILYFSTKEAEVVEGDTPIAAGDIVEITYRGVQGDEDNPGIAVKVVAESKASHLVP